MSSLRKLITSVWSSLKGVLHNIDDKVASRRHVLYLQGDIPTALRILGESLGSENIIVLAPPTVKDPVAMLSVKATRDMIERSVSLIPITVAHVGISLLREEREELERRRVHFV